MVVASVIFIIDIYIVLNERVCSLLGTLVHFTYSRVELSISLRSMRRIFLAISAIVMPQLSTLAIPASHFYMQHSPCVQIE
jgi:hypothetical protein